MTAALPATAAGYETALIAAKNAPPQARRAGDVEKAAKDFEAMYISEMLSHMFDGVGTDPMFGGGKGEDMFRSLLVQEYGKQIAAGPGIGISGQIMDMMIRMQEQTDGG